MSMRRTSSTLTQQGNMLHFELSFSMVCAKKKKKKAPTVWGLSSPLFVSAVFLYCLTKSLSNWFRLDV